MRRTASVLPTPVTESVVAACKLAPAMVSTPRVPAE